MSEIRGKSNFFRQTSIKSDNVVAAVAAAAEYRQVISYQATIGDAQGAPQCDKALKLIIDCHIAALVLSNLYRVIDFIATARCVPQNYTPRARCAATSAAAATSAVASASAAASGAVVVGASQAHCLDSRRNC